MPEPDEPRAVVRRTVAYGSDPSQVADLHLPAPPDGVHAAEALPVVIVVHGGFWKAAYARDLGTPLADDLAGHGVAAWNIEYRRVGNGGGWPNTLLDVAAAVDALADAGMSAARGCLDLARVAVVGHSAGAQLAVWLAARPRLRDGAPGSRPRVSVIGAVSQAGVLDLPRGATLGLGGGAVSAFVGGFPADHPDRYADASPSALVPVGVPTTLVHGLADDVVPIEQSDRYAASAARHGDKVRQIRLPGIGHFELIDVQSPAWVRCRDAALAYVRTELPAS